MRPPVLTPEADRLECGQIFAKIADAAGLVPAIPGYLKKASGKDLFGYSMALFAFLRKNPKAAKSVPLILAKTRGEFLNSANLAALWGILMAMPSSGRKNAARAGFPLGSWWGALLSPLRVLRALFAIARDRSIAPVMALSPAIRQSEALYNSLLSHPEGIWVGRLELDGNMKELRTDDRKINIHIPELDAWLKSIEAESEKKALTPSEEYPFILNAGRHTRNVANTLMRDPSWLKGKRGCAVAINPEDADRLGIKDGTIVAVSLKPVNQRSKLK
jgi:anaerobic selenocysteine-containing dehydrogenase